MYKKDPLLEDIHAIRKKMWEESKQNPHLLIENIKEEAKRFIEEQGYKYNTDGKRNTKRLLNMVEYTDHKPTSHTNSKN